MKNIYNIIKIVIEYRNAQTKLTQNIENLQKNNKILEQDLINLKTTIKVCNKIIQRLRKKYNNIIV